MPTAAIPIIPIADSIEFTELPVIMHAANTKAPHLFSSGMFIFEVTRTGAAMKRLHQILVLTLDPEMSDLLDHSLCLARPEQEFLQTEAFDFASTLSQAFRQMEQDDISTATWNVHAAHGHHYRLGMIRRSDIISSFFKEFQRASTMLDSCN